MADVQDSAVDFDVIVVGAGISGINAAYRIQDQCPDRSYTVLEARDAVGGTWDLFKYPGIRSDSDLHTFGFAWRPWESAKAIASGESIAAYIRDAAAEFGIDRRIQFGHKLVEANWSTESQTWTVEASVDGGTRRKFVRGRFLLLSTGYYDYDEALPADIPGLQDFKGSVVHPQFWPAHLDYANKKIVIIGSGATAVTLLPVLAESAAQVTMLQRSPTYILSRPAVDRSGQLLHSILPRWLAHKLVRAKFLVLPFVFFHFCRAFPRAARRLIERQTARELQGSTVAHQPHFEPRYNPWEQRLCVCPDGDFYAALRAGNASVLTSAIDRVSEHSIRTSSGALLRPDIIVTATGLKIQIAGGARIAVDGSPVRLADKFLWKGVMLQDLPNLATVIGYTNASWTLGADATAHHVARLLNYMARHAISSATPRLPPHAVLTPTPVLNLNSTYVQRGKAEFPKAATTAPWKPRSSYFTDLYEAKWGSIKHEMEFVS